MDTTLSMSPVDRANPVRGNLAMHRARTILEVMRRCFHCGKTNQNEALIPVGDGEFCRSCFDALLLAESPSVQSPRRVDVPPPKAPRAQSSGGSRATRGTCLVCDRDLVGAQALAFLGGQICAACSAEMAAELQAESAPSGAALDAAQPPLSPAGAEHEVFTPGAGTRRCAGCERPMPGPGSYRVIDGDPYCAACLPFFADRRRSALEARSSTGGVSGVSAPASNAPAETQATLSESSCDCCRAAAPAGAELEGFRLCSACIASDVDLALRVARARHRRKLQGLRSALEGDA